MKSLAISKALQGNVYFLLILSGIQRSENMYMVKDINYRMVCILTCVTNKCDDPTRGLR